MAAGAYSCVLCVTVVCRCACSLMLVDGRSLPMLLLCVVRCALYSLYVSLFFVIGSWLLLFVICR